MLTRAAAAGFFGHSAARGGGADAVFDFDGRLCCSCCCVLQAADRHFQLLNENLQKGARSARKTHKKDEIKLK